MPEVGDLTPGEHDRTDVITDLRSVIYAKKKYGGRAQQGEGAAEGRSDDWGEVVTR